MTSDERFRRRNYAASMLRLTKKGISNSYKVLDGETGEQIAVTKTDWGWQAGSVELNGVEISFGSTGSGGDEFVMTENGVARATAKRLSAEGRRRFMIEHGQTTLHFELHGTGQKPFEASRDDMAIGSIALEGFAGRKAVIDLPEDLPESLRLFAGWLALRDWNNAAQVRIRH